MRLTLERIFATYNPKPQSNGSFKMMCPFRENHTDDSGWYSFFANPEINAYHCFSCKAHGPLTALLTGHRFKLTLSQATELVRLDSILDKPIEPYRTGPVETVKMPLFEPEHLIDFSHQPKVYLERGFKKEILRRFRIGIQEIDDVPTITIPLYEDPYGARKLVGVKYVVRTKDFRSFWYSDGFRRDIYFYNQPRNYDKILLGEGESDVWRSVQNGVEFASSLLGTHLSDWHVKELLKYRTVYSAFDNDEAGMLATELLHHKLRAHPDVRIVPYPSEDLGAITDPEELLTGIEEATSYEEYAMEMLLHLEEKYEKIQDRGKELFTNSLKRKR